jgi:hypothetical protein
VREVGEHGLEEALARLLEPLTAGGVHAHTG